jgi:hypothetical protein
MRRRTVAENDSYAGDLDGRQIDLSQCAVAMSCGVCKGGWSIGVDFYDGEGKTIAHGHLDVDRAIIFAQEYGNAIEEVVHTLRKAH